MFLSSLRHDDKLAIFFTNKNHHSKSSLWIIIPCTRSYLKGDKAVDIRIVT